MIMKSSKLILVIAVIFIFTADAGSAFCQELAGDIKKMYSAYSGLENFYTEAAIRIYADHSSEKPGMEQSTVLKKNKNNYLYRVDNVTMLYTDKCYILVNDLEKSIFFSDNPGAQAAIANPLPDVDSLIGKCDSVVFKGVAKSCNYYILYSSKEVIMETHLYVDVKTFLINKIIYYYDKDIYPVNNKVEIDYIKTDLAPVFARNEFSVSKFISRTKDELKPVASYSGYHIVKYDAYAE